MYENAANFNQDIVNTNPNDIAFRCVELNDSELLCVSMNVKIVIWWSFDVYFDGMNSYDKRNQAKSGNYFLFISTQKKTPHNINTINRHLNVDVNIFVIIFQTVFICWIIHTQNAKSLPNIWLWSLFENVSRSRIVAPIKEEKFTSHIYISLRAKTYKQWPFAYCLYGKSIGKHFECFPKKPTHTHTQL